MTRVFFVAMLLVSGEAYSDPHRVVVLPFSGPGGTAARLGVIEGMRKATTMVSNDRYLEEADRLGVDANTPEGVAGVCRELSCHAVVRGDVSREDGGTTVTVTVQSGVNGEVLGKRAATVRSGSMVKRAGIALGRACLSLLADHAGSGTLIEAQPRGRRRGKGQERAETFKEPVAVDETGAGGDDNGGADASDEGSAEGDRAESDAPSIRKSRRESSAAWRHAGITPALFEVSFALGLARRTFDFAQLPTAPATARNEYEGGLFPEFLVQGSIYPAAPFSANFFARNLGLGLAYCRHISASTKQPSLGLDVDTTSHEFWMDARLRWRMVPSWDEVTPALIGFFGGGFREFALGTNPVLKSVNYSFLRLGADLYVPITTPLISAVAGAEIRPVLSVGPEAETYGNPAGLFGWAARIGAAGRHPTGAYYFLTFEYLSFSATFEPKDASTQLLNGSDGFIRLWLGGGYSI